MYRVLFCICYSFCWDGTCFSCWFKPAISDKVVMYRLPITLKAIILVNMEQGIFRFLTSLKLNSTRTSFIFFLVPLYEFQSQPLMRHGQFGHLQPIWTWIPNYFIHERVTAHAARDFEMRIFLSIARISFFLNFGHSISVLNSQLP